MDRERRLLEEVATRPSWPHYPTVDAVEPMARQKAIVLGKTAKTLRERFTKRFTKRQTLASSWTVLRETERSLRPLEERLALMGALVPLSLANLNFGTRHLGLCFFTSLAAVSLGRHAGARATSREGMKALARVLHDFGMTGALLLRLAKREPFMNHRTAQWSFPTKEHDQWEIKREGTEPKQSAVSIVLGHCFVPSAIPGSLGNLKEKLEGDSASVTALCYVALALFDFLGLDAKGVRELLPVQRARAAAPRENALGVLGKGEERKFVRAQMVLRYRLALSVKCLLRACLGPPEEAGAYARLSLLFANPWYPMPEDTGVHAYLMVLVDDLTLSNVAMSEARELLQGYEGVASVDYLKDKRGDMVRLSEMVSKERSVCQLDVLKSFDERIRRRARELHHDGPKGAMGKIWASVMTLCRAAKEVPSRSRGLRPHLVPRRTVDLLRELDTASPVEEALGLLSQFEDG